LDQSLQMCVNQWMIFFCFIDAFLSTSLPESTEESLEDIRSEIRTQLDVKSSKVSHTELDYNYT
jgi:hypothetical protein